MIKQFEEQRGFLGCSSLSKGFCIIVYYALKNNEQIAKDIFFMNTHFSTACYVLKLLALKTPF